MASREVKPALRSMKSRTMALDTKTGVKRALTPWKEERGGSGNGTVKAAMTPPKEERGKKETRKPTRTLKSSGR